MISPAYIGTQFRAVLTMAAGHPLWRQYLDTGTDGFYRSFAALVLSVPLAIAFELMARRLFAYLPEMSAAADTGLPAIYLAVLQMAVTAASWIAFVFALIVVARRMGQERRISALVVGYNWAELLVAIIQTATMFLILISPDPAVFYAVIIGPLIFKLYLMWGVFRRALDLNAIQTIGLIVMAFFITLLVNLVISAAGYAVFSVFAGPA